MSHFKVFNYIDQAIIVDETSAVYASKTPAVWPSEASVNRIDKSLFNIFGGCHRKSFYRMIGWPKREETSADSPWKWIVGRAVEDKVTDLAKIETKDIDKIYVANGVRLFVEDVYLPIEMDVIVRDPETHRGWIVECKTYDGYYAEKQIEKEQRPKEENLIQACIYLLETKNGERLKHLVRESIAERAKLDEQNIVRRQRGEKVREHRNRIEADLRMLESLDDGPLGCKLIYISRGSCTRNEFDIEIMEDFDGFHYPMVNGEPYKIFTIESIYERFRTLQNFWFRARTEAVDRLEEKGIDPPDTVQLVLSRGDMGTSHTELRDLSKEEWALEKRYYELLEAEVRALPESFFPRPEYEWSYSPERIEDLFAAKQIPKGKYKDYKDGKINRLGDWQCGWCPFAATGCISKQRPDLVYQVFDFANLPEDIEVTLGS
jgi:hypothetical protein